MAETTEVRIIDAVTGGEKGQKLARFDLMPPEALWYVAEVFGRGAKKYADRNWEKGYKWGLSFGALQRHLMLWQLGEDIDEETGSYHLAQVAWHALVLLTFYLRSIGSDDVRSKATRAGRLLSQTSRPIALTASAQPCGCDAGANWVCETHRKART